MANLNTTGIATSAMQGIDRGINSAGAIYGLMQKKEEMDRERSLAPVRERMLRQSEEAGNLSLSEQQAQADYLNSPFNYKGTQQYLNMTPEEKANADNIWGNLPSTRRGLQQYMDMVKTNESLAKDLMAAHARPLEGALVKAGNAYNALIAPGTNAAPEQIATAKADYEQAKGAFEAAKRDAGKVLKGVAVSEIIKNNPDLMKSPAIQMILPIVQQTGDISGLLDIAKGLAKNEGRSPGVTTAVGAYIQGEINKGRTDLSAIGKEAANLKSDLLSSEAEKQKIRIGIATQEGKARSTEERNALDNQAQILKAIATLEKTGVIDALVASITNKPINSTNPGDVENAKKALLIRLRDVQRYISNPADRVVLPESENVPATMQGLESLMPYNESPPLNLQSTASGIARSAENMPGKLIGTRGGKNVYELPNGKWQIGE